ncbi:MAG TPA: SUMF1/EgtB/PvdO family nonheme iron enzyme, partial [Kofleriaceae bacterium]
AYDAADDKTGKQKWVDYEKRAAELDRVWGQAELAYESALLLDSSRRDVRDRIASVLADRAQLARRDQREDSAKELYARLAVYDDGTHRARLEAPATVDVILEAPADTRVELRASTGKSFGAPPWRVPPGAYQLALTSPTHVDATLPLLVEPGEQRRVVLHPPRRADVPKDWIWIPAGRGLFGTADLGDEGDFMQTAPLHAIDTDAFLIQRHETTFGEWIEYLDALAPAERTARTPAVNNVPLLAGGPGAWRLRFPLPAGELVGEPGQPARYAARPGSAPFDWTKLPVVGIAPSDAIAYADWLATTKRVTGARLCDEFEWERAARGADGRRFPHGAAVLAAGDANVDLTWANDPARYGPDPVGSYPRSASPFGLLDTAGNVFEMAKSRINASPLAKGGAFKFPPSAARLDYREATDDKLRNEAVGVRLCANAPR